MIDLTEAGADIQIPAGDAGMVDVVIQPNDFFKATITTLYADIFPRILIHIQWPEGLNTIGLPADRRESDKNYYLLEIVRTFSASIRSSASSTCTLIFPGVKCQICLLDQVRQLSDPTLSLTLAISISL